VLDFGALPPEINSGRMYAGPGSGPMMVASAAWDVLAAELGTAASGYNSVIDELTSGPWVGPASASMVSAVTPYVTWLSSVAGQAEQAASQGRAAAAAFEAAFAMTVPPPVIAANRVLLMNLIATNFLGINTPAIFATEAQYMEMWAQDAGAMYAYAGSSMAASQFAPFVSPPDTTTPDGDSKQFAAVAQAAAQPAGGPNNTPAATTPGTPPAQGTVPTVPGAAAPRVSVLIDGRLATVRVAIEVRYPAPIRQVTRRVREHVSDRVGELTGLDVRHVDIDIPALITPDRGRRVQ